MGSSTADDPAALKLEARGRNAILGMPEGLALLPRFDIPLLPFAPMGAASLRAVFGASDHPDGEPCAPLGRVSDVPPLRALIDDLERAGHGVIMTMGKGGVGKTTIAAAIAVELARRGRPGFRWTWCERGSSLMPG